MGSIAGGEGGYSAAAASTQILMSLAQALALALALALAFAIAAAASMLSVSMAAEKEPGIQYELGCQAALSRVTVESARATTHSQLGTPIGYRYRTSDTREAIRGTICSGVPVTYSWIKQSTQ